MQACRKGSSFAQQPRLLAVSRVTAPRVQLVLSAYSRVAGAVCGNVLTLSAFRNLTAYRRPRYLVPKTGQPATDETQYSGLIAEFIEALRQEVRSARRTGRAVSLCIGRRISRIGDQCQYVFEVENVLNVPADSPAELKLPGRQQPLRATIISVEGLSVTLSVPVDLDSFVPRASLQTDLTFLMERLIERLASRAGSASPVAERILGMIPVSGAAQPAASSDLNEEQSAAVASSLGREVTFIWGPAGTGKTKTIGAICAEHCRRNRSVLLVSHTNIAVDQALWQISETLSPDEIAYGQVLRVGSLKDQRLEQRPDLLLQTHVKRRTEEL